VGVAILAGFCFVAILIQERRESRREAVGASSTATSG
jgi:hypothetical protein